MGIVNKIKLSELNKTSNLIASSRVQYYWERMQIKPNNRPLNYYLNSDNDLSVGQLKTEEYAEKSEINFIPIIDQSKLQIAGYTDREDLIYKGKLPVIIFGDHTRIFKFVDFPFVQGADGIKILYPDNSIVDPLFFFYLLRYIDVPSRGYNRHFSILSVQRYLLFDIEKQKNIISKILPFEKEINELENSKVQPLNIINQVFCEAFGFNWEEFEKLSREKIYKIRFSKLHSTVDFRSATKFHSIKYDFLKLPVFNQFCFKDFSNNMTLGRQITPEDFEEESEFYYLMPNAIKTFKLEDDLLKPISNTFFNRLQHISLKYGDLLLAASGEGTIGKAAIYNSEKEAVTSQFIMKIELNDKRLVDYFHYYMQTSYFQLTVEKFKKGMGNMTNIFVSQVKDFPILYDENKVTEIIDTIKTQLDEQKVIDRQIEEKQQAINKIIEDAIKQEQN